MKFHIDDGIVKDAIFIPSPNYNERPNPTDIRLIVIHNISLPPSEFGLKDKNGQHFVKAFFQNQLNAEDHPYFSQIHTLQVSAHFFIERDGQLTQFVNTNQRAWHAGQSNYLGKENCNDFSIGIELEGDDFSPFSDAQYDTLSALVVSLYQAYPQTVGHLVGHSDIARGRKTDPGEYFDWLRFRQNIHQLRCHQA